MVEKDDRGLFGERAIGVAIGRRNRDQKAVGIPHRAAQPFLDDRGEARDDHPLAVEGHRRTHRLHTRIAHHLFGRGVARRAIGIFEPGKDDLLALLCLHCGPEVIDLSDRDVIAPAFDMAANAEFLEQRHRIGGMLAIGVLRIGRHRQHKAFDIGHRLSPFFFPGVSGHAALGSSVKAASCAASARPKAGRSRQRAR
jgi:hypothetical protein